MYDGEWDVMLCLFLIHSTLLLKNHFAINITKPSAKAVIQDRLAC